MCGLAGFLGFGPLDADGAAASAARMADAILHRGPDSSGCWVDGHAQVALAHRRLAIVDLSPAGHQPMLSPSGRFVAVYNGEIYNHRELRTMLGADLAWRGHSDTETLLAAFDAWGIEKTLQECAGMFALAVWDRGTRELTLARDRLGEKPLYYGWQGGVLLFGSELKALRAHPLFQGAIDRNAIALQLRYNSVPAPFSIYEGIHKVPAGTLLTVSSRRPAVEPQPRAYWSLQDVLRRAAADPFQGTDSEALQELDRVLSQAVRGQMAADVPLGAFLSGGIDSSLITAVMQAASGQPVRSFTIGFDEDTYDEAEYARAIAQHLGCEHTELYVSPRDALEVIPRLPTIYDEPFSDSSQIPTYLVSCLARQQVTVALSGDGGDELFGGYSRYVATQKWWPQLSRVPAPLRRAAARGLTAVGPGTWDGLARRVARRSHAKGAVPNLSNTVQKFAGALRARDDQALYQSFVSHWEQPEAVVIGSAEPPLAQLPTDLPLRSLSESMMARDTVTYLPDDILVKVDRAAMSVSLETRVPFLDHRVVEFAWRLPLSMKIRNGKGKWLTRQLLFRHVPRELVERPKMGFAVPIDSWLRGPLRDWAEALLEPSRLRAEGVFDVATVRRTWDEHQAGRRNWQHHLWDILMFLAWKEARA